MHRGARGWARRPEPWCNPARLDTALFLRPDHLPGRDVNEDIGFHAVFLRQYLDDIDLFTELFL